MEEGSISIAAGLAGAVGGIAAAIVIFWKISPSDRTLIPYRTARSFAAWVAAIVTASLLNPVIGRLAAGFGFDVDKFMNWLLGLAIWGGLAFLVGLAWSALVQREDSSKRNEFATNPITQNKSQYNLSSRIDLNTPKKVNDIENRFWALALQEFDSPQRDIGTWARAFSENNGNEAAAKAMYLRLRMLKFQEKSAETTREPSTSIAREEVEAKGSSRVDNHNSSNKEVVKRLQDLGYIFQCNELGKNTIVSPDGKSVYHSYNDEELNNLIDRLSRRAARDLK